MVRVHVWRGVLFDDKTWTGHAALSAGKDLANPSLYISYWPKKGGDQRPGKKGRKLTRSRAGTYQEALADDVTEMGAPPSNTVDIAGLAEAAMTAFWREVLTGEDKRFKLAGHNCSTVVAGALKRGYVESLDRASFGELVKVVRWLDPSNAVALGLADMSSDTIWYPRQVLRYAEALRRVTAGW